MQERSIIYWRNSNLDSIIILLEEQMKILYIYNGIMYIIAPTKQITRKYL